MITCPKCAHVRDDYDNRCPSWQCPNCGVAYAKAGKQKQVSRDKALKPTEQQPTQNQNSRRIARVFLGMACVALLVASIVGKSPLFGWAFTTLFGIWILAQFSSWPSEMRWRRGGWLLALSGLIWGMIALNMNTTVEVGGEFVAGYYVPSSRVYNIGLMESRRTSLLCRRLLFVRDWLGGVRYFHGQARK